MLDRVNTVKNSTDNEDLLCRAHNDQKANHTITDPDSPQSHISSLRTAIHGSQETRSEGHHPPVAHVLLVTNAVPCS